MKVVSRFGVVSAGMLLVLGGCGSATYFRGPGGGAGAEGGTDAGETGVIFIGSPDGGTGGSPPTIGEGPDEPGSAAGGGGATTVGSVGGTMGGDSTGVGGGGGSGADARPSPSGAAGAEAASGGASQAGGQPGSPPGRGSGGGPAPGSSPGTGGKAPSSADGGSGGSSRGGARGGTGGQTGAGGGPATTGGGGAGASTTTGSSGGKSGTAGAGAAGATVPLDDTKFSFEPPYSSSDPSAPYQMWRAAPGSPAFESLVQPTTAEHFLGAHALAGPLNATSPQVYDLAVSAPRVPPGATVTFHVMVPARSTVTWVEPYVQQGPPGNLLTGEMVPIGRLSIDAWNTLTVAVPANASPLQALGVRFNVSAPWRGTVYVDSVDW